MHALTADSSAVPRSAFRISRGLLTLGAALFFCMLPDADAVPGVLFGNLRKYHNNLTHSLVVGLAVALGAAACARAVQAGSTAAWFLLALAAYEAHVVMDYLTFGRGIMAFWPLTARRFQSPVLLFYGLRWETPALDSAHLWTLLNELAFAALLFLVVRHGRKRHAD